MADLEEVVPKGVCWWPPTLTYGYILDCCCCAALLHAGLTSGLVLKLSLPLYWASCHRGVATVNK